MECPIFREIINKLRDIEWLAVWEHNIFTGSKKNLIFRVNTEWFEYNYNYEFYYNEHPELKDEFIDSYIYYILHLVSMKEKMKSSHLWARPNNPGFENRKTMTIHYTDLFKDDLDDVGVEFDYTREFTFDDLCDYLYWGIYNESDISRDNLKKLWDEGIIDLIQIEYNDDFQDLMKDKYRKDAEEKYREIYK